MLPGGGLAGAAEDPALLSCAGLKRETPDRPQPGVPQVLSEGVCRLATEIRATYQEKARRGWSFARKGNRAPAASLKTTRPGLQGQGPSVECREFLRKCKKGELRGITSVTVLAEVTHRLVMIEAVSKRLVSAGNVAQKLGKRD